MKPGIKLLLITLPLALLGVGFLAYTVTNSPPPERNQPQERAAAVRAIIAKSYLVSPLVTGFGLVHPARTYEAIAQVGGTAEYVNPDLAKGAILPKGAVLLRLSPSDFNLAIAQARANIRAAEARLAEITVSEANQTAALAIETEALALKTADLERTETLFANGTVSQAARDGARAAHLAQRQKVQSIENSLSLIPTQKQVQTEQIAVQKASLETATLNLERTELTLPFTARVASVTVEEGQFVRVGQVAAVLDSVDAAEVEAQISVADMRLLLQSANVALAVLPIDPSGMNDILRGLDLTAKVTRRLGDSSLQWHASVDRISDTIDQKSGALGVIVRVDTAYSGVTPGDKPPLTKGMFVEVTLSAPSKPGMVLPRTALHDGQLMLADSDNRLRLLPITPALVRDDILVVTEGLEPGTRVVVSTPVPLIEGLLLEITEDKALEASLADAAGPAR